MQFVATFIGTMSNLKDVLKSWKNVKRNECNGARPLHARKIG